ncbi:hypothetical protein A8C56_02940 [Niabella ginsenosidivorans]|uniref:Uncharacterized protein n=2 Tax=Niabella ginsenosidivorans TaxID=1176587 RepID=A0A1A9HXG2_9BACT|nr:hypothetical protein A8C56_02940 [Niabella ginsenosidivorans]
MKALYLTFLKCVRTSARILNFYVMKQNLSPEQLAENKAKLMAQVDSLTNDQLPEEVEPEMINKALRMYKLFSASFMDSSEDMPNAVNVIESLNESTLALGERNSTMSGIHDMDLWWVTRVSNYFANALHIVYSH